ncbi:UNVERIFIED_CONTAM: putative AC transposase [Sesamum radiatum]|uniref:AC transposase n=1 Tax=Sesamum radiatum TaxID=300843 RepID=A0AAW2V3I3_SESRA
MFINYRGSCAVSVNDPNVMSSSGVETCASLTYWIGGKINSPKLPILAKIARDILANSVTGVASEAAFSVGGRVIDDSHTCLLSDVVEALVVVVDWIGSIPKRS